MNKRCRRPPSWLLLILTWWAPAAHGVEDVFDRIDQALTTSFLEHRVRTRLSGALDLEGYRLSQPSPGLLYTSQRDLFNPRLSLFFDAQLGAYGYVFAQGRVDRGFDPADENPRARLDEIAVRITPWTDSRLNVQVGKFATVIGNWVARHGSWENPFITAPLPYENLTGVWDSAPPRSAFQLQNWAHVAPDSSPVLEQEEKPLRIPFIWGPAYSQGAAVFGRIGKFDYAIEIKSAGLSSRPGLWHHSRELWRHPAFGTRLGFRPNAMWNFGLSASRGGFLDSSATPAFSSGLGYNDYQQTVLAHDASFAWHHLQLWAEIIHTRFSIPPIGTARGTAYYVEAKYKITPQFSAAVRWNEQRFSPLRDGRGNRALWGRDVTRIDFAPSYRFTPHLQLKLQSSWLHHASGPQRHSATHAAQFTVRF